MLEGKRILLVIAGGIAAYKCLELIRRVRDRGGEVRCILTRAGSEFVTPLSLAALSGQKVYGELFSLTDEAEISQLVSWPFSSRTLMVKPICGLRHLTSTSSPWTSMTWLLSK